LSGLSQDTDPEDASGEVEIFKSGEHLRVIGQSYFDLTDSTTAGFAVVTTNRDFEQDSVGFNINPPRI